MSFFNVQIRIFRVLAFRMAYLFIINMEYFEILKS